MQTEEKIFIFRKCLQFVYTCFQPKVETVQRKELSPVPMETDKSSSHKKIRVATSDGRQVCFNFYYQSFLLIREP